MLNQHKNFDLEKLREKFSRTKFSWRKVWKEIWPINWSNLLRFELVKKAIVQASYPVKVFFTVTLSLFLVSVGFFFYGIYLSLTVEVGAAGGQMREAVVGGTMKLFNPVLDPSKYGTENNEAEKKVNRLIYHPLYEVVYPDFLEEDVEEPSVKPILLSEEPKWTDLNSPNPEDRYKTLQFTLRQDIKWSNGDLITLDDVKYTFNRLQEEGANPRFRNVFKSLTFKKISENEFQLISSTSNPSLIYSADFSPISSDYYSSQDLGSLYFSGKSKNPQVTSGFFKFPDGKVDDPDTEKEDMVENPISDDNSDNYRIVVLEKNSVKNTKEEVYLNRYIIKRYDDTLIDPKSKDKVFLEEDAKDEKIDLYTRFLGTNMNIKPSDLSERVNLNQKTIPTNTVYSAYFNISPGTTGYLVNQSLRHYISCYLVNYTNSGLDEYLEEIPETKRIIPIHFNTDVALDCSSPDSLLDENYTVQYDERNSMKDVLLHGVKFREYVQEGRGFVMVGYKEYAPLLADLERYFRDKIGIPVTLVTENSAVKTALENKNYNIAVLPATLVNKDPYSLFGAKGQNLAQINYNSRVRDYSFEENLEAYSLSNLSDETAKTNLIKFFSEQFVAVNLFRAKNEFNYSMRVNGLYNNLPDFSAFVDELYLDLPNWYVEQKRRWRWS